MFFDISTSDLTVLVCEGDWGGYHGFGRLSQDISGCLWEQADGFHHTPEKEDEAEEERGEEEEEDEEDEEDEEKEDEDKEDEEEGEAEAEAEEEGDEGEEEEDFSNVEIK